jgi:hypothetical protein
MVNMYVYVDMCVYTSFATSFVWQPQAFLGDVTPEW